MWLAVVVIEICRRRDCVRLSAFEVMCAIQTLYLKHEKFIGL